MCGILGIYSFPHSNTINKEKFIRSCNLMTHRGPDDSGFWSSPDNLIMLGHRRLSIIDLSGGHQPMLNNSEDLIIVFNGEIYNFPELKQNLLSKGYIFNTNGDTEVILNHYKEYGIKGINKFNGIFAFGIYDIRKKELILARDHFGVKPIYYFEKDGVFAFASEIKSLLGLNLLDNEIDIEALNGNISYRFNPSPKTLFKNIKKLPPGFYLKIGIEKHVEIDTYINDKINIDNSININDAIELYSNSLESAVKRQLISDVPVGMLLSGGVDSALVCYLMQKNYKDKIKSFTVAFEGSGKYNELELAKESSNIIGTEHYDITITQKEYFDFFTKSFYYLEEPIAITSITSLYFIDKLASKQLKVVLTGQGADEVWGGYKRYTAEKFINDYNILIKILPVNLLLKLYPNNEGLKRFMDAKKYWNEIERFDSIYSVFNRDDRKLLLNSDAFLGKTYCIERVEYLYEQVIDLKESLSKLLYIDTRLNLSNCLLLLADKMSMANSLELRVPYLDIDLVRLIESFPAKYKIKGLNNKYLHKLAAKKLLPQKLVNRKKIGFETPMGEWMKNEIGDYLNDLVSSQNSLSRDYFNIDYIQSLIKDHQKHIKNNERKLFIILTLEKWYQEFFKLRF